MSLESVLFKACLECAGFDEVISKRLPYLQGCSVDAEKYQSFRSGYSTSGGIAHSTGELFIPINTLIIFLAVKRIMIRIKMERGLWI